MTYMVTEKAKWRAKSAKDFFSKLKQVAPFKIKAVQTDNGLEFEMLHF